MRNVYFLSVITVFFILFVRIGVMLFILVIFIHSSVCSFTPSSSKRF